MWKAFVALVFLLGCPTPQAPRDGGYAGDGGPPEYEMERIREERYQYCAALDGGLEPGGGGDPDCPPINSPP